MYYTSASTFVAINVDSAIYIVNSNSQGLEAGPVKRNSWKRSRIIEVDAIEEVQWRLFPMVFSRSSICVSDGVKIASCGPA